MKYYFSFLGYCFHYQSILFSELDKGESASPVKKSSSKSPTRRSSLKQSENAGDFSPLLSRSTKKNTGDFMTSSIGNFNNPLLFPRQNSVNNALKPWQEKLLQTFGKSSFSEFY